MYAPSIAIHSSATFYTILLIFVSLKYSAVRARRKKAIKVHNKSWRTRYRLAYGRNNGLSQWLSVLYSDTD